MNEEGKSPLGFEVIDKRGRNNPVQEVVKPVVRNEAPTQARSWKSVGYMLVFNKLDTGEVLMQGRAVGLDQEGHTFVADYTLMPIQEPGLDWTIDAKRRLDTFLNCPCSQAAGICDFHRKRAPVGWIREDQGRMREQGERPLPEALEVFYKAEATRAQAQRVLAPRR